MSPRRVLWLVPAVIALTAAGCDDGGAAPVLDAAGGVANPERDAGAAADASADADLDPLARALASCAFQAGARVAETLGLDPQARAAIPIKNIIVMMRENRSFDHLLGRLHEAGQT